MNDALDVVDYNHWANTLWIDALTAWAPALLGPERMKLMAAPGPWPTFTGEDPQERAGHILTNIMWAEQIWARRCGAAIQTEDRTAKECAEALRSAWHGELERRTWEEPIAYQNTCGVPFVLEFGAIFRHAMNHGAYHRGQLREVAETVGQAWPETDYLLFALDRK